MASSIACILLCALFQDPAPADGASAAGSAEESARSFAARIVSAFERRDAEAIDGLFDVDRLLDRALDGFDLARMARKGFRDGFRKSFRGSNLLQVLPAETPIECFRVVAGRDESWVARIRIVYPGLLFDYFDFEIEFVEGEPTVVDVHYASELTSQSGFAREAWLMSAEAQDLDAFRSHATRLARSLTLERRGENTAALELVEAMEREGVTSLRLRAQKLRLLGRLGLSERAAELEADLTKELGEHPEIALPIYDAALRTGRLEDALRHVDAVDRWAGDDPYLEYIRALIHRRLGRVDEAKSFLDRAVAESPGWRQPLLVLVDVAVEAKDHETTAELLTRLEKDFEMDVFAVVTSNVLFAAFVSSEPGKRWIAERERVTPPSAGETDAGG